MVALPELTVRRLAAAVSQVPAAARRASLAVARALVVSRGLAVRVPLILRKILMITSHNPAEWVMAVAGWVAVLATGEPAVMTGSPAE